MRLSIPLPWMIGAMLLVTAAAISGAPVLPPTGLRKVLLPIIGVMLGSGFHPGIASQIGNWTTTGLALPPFILLAMGSAYLVYRRLGGYDPVTAYFSSAPGGLSEMMILGADAGGNERRIALAHASRILVVVGLVSFSYAALVGVTSSGSGRSYTAIADVPPADMAILAGCALAGALGAPHLKAPAPLILGPMALSATVHFLGWTNVPPPTLAVNAAQVVIGTVVGCRFVGVPLREVARDIFLAAVASVAMLVAALLTALGVSASTGLGMATAFLAFSPGGLPEMSLLALALGADIAYVATAHLVRISIVVALAPLAFRWARTRAG